MTACSTVSSNLFLVSNTFYTASLSVVSSPVNHVAVIDCSGSMSGDLPLLRKQLKNKLSTLLRPGDTFSAIWFSGRGEFGTLLDTVGVESLKDITSIHTAIDRWLRPIGLTGFKEPLREVETLINRTKAKNSNEWSLLFLSDGCDNCWPRTDIVSVVETLTGKLARATVVEYGYYADRAFLSKMASKLGGEHVFAQDFEGYDIAFETVLKKESAGKKHEFVITGDVIGGIAWTFEGGSIVAFDVGGDGKVSVPESTKDLFHLSPVKPDAYMPLKEDIQALYSALALFSLRAKPEVIFPILSALGDVAFINKFANCFGKQSYSDFAEQAKAATFNSRLRLLAGFDPDRVPAEDAFTLIEFLQLLASDENNRVMLDSEDFKYSRIGRARVANDDALKFVPHGATRLQQTLGEDEGYSVRNLVFNEDRPNVSIGVRKEGTIDLSDEADRPATVPTTFETAIHRNYAIIKDGLVNVDKLPVKITKKTVNAMRAAGFDPSITFDSSCIDFLEKTIDLRQLPIINRKMVKQLSADTFFKMHFETMCWRAAQKVYGTYYKELVVGKEGVTRTSEGLVSKHGAAAAAWLKERGITDQGFSPRGVSAVATDFYMGKELKVSLKGLSDLPSVKEAKEKLAKATEKKPAPIGARLMRPYIEEVETFLSANAGRESVIRGWLDGQQLTARTEVRSCMAKTARDMLCVVVGQTWFKEFPSLEHNTLSIDTSFGKIDCKVELREIEIKL